jgi:hypothetical protein
MWVAGTMRSARADRPALARAGSGRAGWRSHTFADGVRSLTLLGPLDAILADRLQRRISELLERGARRLIVDASATEPTGDQPTLLAAVFAGRRASYQAVVVAPPGSALDDLLPDSVGVSRSLTDAHRQLASGIVRHDARRRAPAPAGRISAEERNALSTRQSLRWAERAAREGDYERALGWLSMVERVEGRLAEDWRQLREIWIATWAAQGAPGPPERPGRR